MNNNKLWIIESVSAEGLKVACLARTKKLALEWMRRKARRKPSAFVLTYRRLAFEGISS